MLSALAYAGNAAALTLFSPVSFVFGSIFALIAVRLFGLAGGCVVALMGSCYTVYAWGHPYALIIFTAEAAAVYVLSRRVTNLAMADALFWIFAGCPLALVFYGGAMEMDSVSAGLIALKQTTNGVFNAVVAGLLLIALRRWLPQGFRAGTRASFHSLVFYVLVLVASVSAAGMTVMESRREYRQAVEHVDALVSLLASWTRQELAEGQSLTGLEAAFERDIGLFMANMAHDQPRRPEIGLALTGPDGASEVLIGTVSSLTGTGEITRYDDTLMLWKPAGDMPAMTRSRESRYLLRQPLEGDPAGRELLVEVSAKALVAQMEAAGRWNMMVLAIAIGVAMIVSKVLSEWLGAPIGRLARLSEGLTGSITSGQNADVIFPTSNIAEYETLSASLRDMSSRLSESFRSQKAVQKTLEERVQDRTRALDRMSQVARQTTNSVMIMDTDARIEWVNEAFTELTGYTLDGVVGKMPGRVFLGPESDKDVVGDMREALNRIEGFDVEVVIYGMSQQPFWAEVRCNPLWDSGGHHAGFIAIMSDITQRRKTSQMLQDSLERVQLATEVAQIGIWTYDPVSGKVEWSDGNFRLYGLSPRSFNETIAAWPDLLNPEDRARVAKEVEAALADDATPFESEFRIYNPEKGARVLRSVARVTRDEQGRGVRMTGVNLDVTEDRRAAEALRNAAKRNAAVLDNVADSIITLDRKGAIQSFNRASESMFGYPAEDVIGRDVKTLFPSEAGGSENGFMAEYLSERGPELLGQVREMEALRRNGEAFPVALAVSEVETRGETVFIAIIRDITERRRVARMQAEFIATVSHELRTPLTSIKGTLSLIRGGVLGTLDEKGEKIVGAAMANSDRLSGLIDEILDLERLTAGKLTLDIAPCRLDVLVRQSVEVNHGYADRFGVQLAIEGKLPELEVAVDQLRAGQILSNYISNAVKFSAEGQTVTITVEKARGAVRVVVSDRGQGIPEKFHGAIFKKFSQTDASDTRKSGGSGLGLAISKELASQMGGRVGFVSHEGEGARFWVEFPLCETGIDVTGAFEHA
ncbi:MAG: PAS domain S-box protein [Roseovarius sp.]|uniref:PAS domain S-box protein n=1 Tax=Roseovarius sp. TaxID=1486281 RepID=UPI0032EFE80A